MMTHAFFKRMLFLGTGSLMTHHSGGQDSRFFGSRVISFGAMSCFFVRCFCLAGFPFLVGFYSKDSIISYECLFGGYFLFFLFLLGCCLTVGYRVRLFRGAFKFFLKSSAMMRISEDSSFFLFVILLFLVNYLTGGLFF